MDENFRNMVQQAADYSGLEQCIYQRKDGSLLSCAKGNYSGLQMVLKPNETPVFIEFIKPSYWPKDAPLA